MEYFRSFFFAVLRAPARIKEKTSFLIFCFAGGGIHCRI